MKTFFKGLIYAFFWSNVFVFTVVNIQPDSKFHPLPPKFSGSAPGSGTHLRDLAPGQHSSEETLQRWRAVGDTVSNLTNQGFKPQTSRTDSNVLKTIAHRPVYKYGLQLI